MRIHFALLFVASYALCPLGHANEANVSAARPALGEQALPASQSWVVRLPMEAKVSFRGAPINDAAAGSGNAMLYPAPNAVGLFAALVTHGLLNGVSRRAEENRQLEAANKVLEPYQSVLNEFRYEDLFKLALEQGDSATKMRVASTGEVPGADWFLASEPQISMTQDQCALVLDTSVVAYAPNLSTMPAYQNAIRVVSTPISVEDAKTYWSDQNGKNIKVMSARLLATAIAIAIREAANAGTKAAEPSASVQKTVRFTYGKSERVERAELIDVSADRAVLKTLRGGLMVVPLKSGHAYAASQRADEKVNTDTTKN